MKARQVLFFILGVFLMLGAAWAVFPAEGVRFGTKRLRFASYAGHVRDAKEKKVDVDSVLNALDGRFAMLGDTFDFYRQFFYENPDRIYLPNDDYTFFDPVSWTASRPTCGRRCRRASAGAARGCSPR